jgi:predicted phosphoribosyltransferase
MSNRSSRDRHDAGRVLAGLLGRYRGQAGVIVLGMSPGGVTVAYEVAAELGVPLDVFPVGTTRAVIRHVAHEEGGGKRYHQRVYREGRPTPDLAGTTVILVVGLASGTTMPDAVETLRQSRPGRLVVAMTAASEATCERLRREVDEVVCATTTEPSTRGEVHLGLRIFER